MTRALKPVLVVILALAAVVVLSKWMHPREVIPWRTDFQAASAEARHGGKPMLLDFSAEWCGPCQEMRRTTWSNANVAAALADYVPVQIDVDAHSELARQFEVSAIPRLIVLDSRGQVLKSSEGLLDPPSLIAWLATKGTSTSAEFLLRTPR